MQGTGQAALGLCLGHRPHGGAASSNRITPDRGAAGRRCRAGWLGGTQDGEGEEKQVCQSSREVAVMTEFPVSWPGRGPGSQEDKVPGTDSLTGRLGGCGQVIGVPGGQLPHPQAHGLSAFYCVPCRAWAARPREGV